MIQWSMSGVTTWPERYIARKRRCRSLLGSSLGSLSGTLARHQRSIQTALTRTKLSRLDCRRLFLFAQKEDMMNFPDKITYGEKYRPAMSITDQTEADDWFEACVEHCMRFNRTRAEAEDIERENLGYYAGYYDFETRQRVERLFGGVHPIFGSTANGEPTPEEAFNAGAMWAGVAIP